MDRSFIYQSSRNFMKRNFWKIVISLGLIVLINSILSLVLGKTITNSIITFNLGFEEEVLNTMGQSLNNGMPNKNLLPNIFQSTIGYLMNSAFMFAVLRAYRNNWYFRISTIFKQLFTYFLPTLLCCIIVSFIAYCLALIPLVGWILLLIFNVYSYYVILIVHEEESGFIEGIKKSIQILKGNRVNIILVQLRYLFGFLVILVLCLSMVVFGEYGLMLGVLMALFVLIRYYPYVYIATAVSYAKINKKETDVLYQYK